jgi:hypothetical protein
MFIFMGDYNVIKTSIRGRGLVENQNGGDCRFVVD